MSEVKPFQKIPKRKNIGGFTYILFLFIATCALVVLLPLYQTDPQIIFPQFAVTYLLLAMGGSVYHSYQHKNAWEKYAHAKGFLHRLEPSGLFSKTPIISGDYRGHSIRISMFNIQVTTGQRNGNALAYYTEIKIILSCRALGKTIFELQRKSFFTPREKLIYERGDEHLKDFQSENRQLNDLCRVRTSSENFSKRLKQDMGIQQGLVDMAQQTKDLNITIRENYLRFYQPGKIVDPIYLHPLLDLLLDIAICAENRQSERYL